MGGVESQDGQVSAVPDRIDLGFQAYMCPFESPVRVTDQVLADIVGIGEPERAQDDEGRIGCAGTGEMLVEVARDFGGCRLTEYELTFMVAAEVGNIGMDADTDGIGAFVQHFKMTETGAGKGFGGIRMSEADDHGLQGGQGGNGLTGYPGLAGYLDRQ